MGTGGILSPRVKRSRGVMDEISCKYFVATAMNIMFHSDKQFSLTDYNHRLIGEETETGSSLRFAFSGVYQKLTIL
jgi:hypothetical protein